MRYDVYRKRELVTEGLATQLEASQEILRGLAPMLPDACLNYGTFRFIVFQPEPLEFDRVYWYPKEREGLVEHWKAYLMLGGTLMDYGIQVFGYER